MLTGVRATAGVMLSGRQVGTMTFRSGGGTFRYTDDLVSPDHRVLGQVFEEAPRARHVEHTGLPSWFANLLPESGSGLRRYYAARFGAATVDDARLLLTLGDDLPGDVTVVPLDVPAEGTLVDRVEARFDESGMHLSALAGAQLKMSVLRDGERLTVPSGDERGRWIAKFPDTLHRGLAENEFLMMRWAAAAGVAAPLCELVPSADVPDVFARHMPAEAPVYVVARFDRPDVDLRVHIEDLAQVLGVPPALRAHGTDYGRIGRYLQERTGPEGFAAYLRRVVAMVLMGNEDAHLKNWSLWYPDGRTPALAPAYDLVCTTVYSTLGRGLVFPIAGVTASEHVGLGELVTLAEYAGADAELGAHLVVTAVRDLLRAWPGVREPALFPDLVAHIDDRLERHPLVGQTR